MREAMEQYLIPPTPHALPAHLNSPRDLGLTQPSIQQLWPLASAAAPVGRAGFVDVVAGESRWAWRADQHYFLADRVGDEGRGVAVVHGSSTRSTWTAA